mgnify:CR=1 FL=1
MVPNFLVLLGTAFIPFLIAYAWYHPSLFGGDNWKEIAGLTDEQHNKKVKPLKLGLSILLNFLIAFGLYNLCVHESGVFSMVNAEVEAMTTGTAKAFLDEYAGNHLSLGHGVIHGLVSGLLLFALPVLGYVTIFERKSTKYLLVNLGFWAISMALMGGVIAQWGWTAVY